MIEYDTLLSIPFLKKSGFTGSDRGMRYFVKKIGNPAYDPEDEVKKNEKEFLLKAAVWPGPFAEIFTKEELFDTACFSFDDAGRRAAVDWLNAKRLESEELYEAVYAHPQRYAKKHHKE